MLGATAFTSCDNDFEQPPLAVPQTRWEANTTIEQLKTAYWKTDGNYCDEVGLTEEGDSLIIKGRVISADSTGNIFKKFVIFDGTAAIPVSVNQKELYGTYHFGQEVYINMTGLHVGKYANLMQIGRPEAYNGGLQTSFLEESTLALHAQPVGWACPAEVDTLVLKLSDLASIANDQKKTITTVSRLVRFDDVYWENAGETFSTYQNTTNRIISDKAGNKLIVRNSGYSSFYYETIPGGYGSVVGILGQFNNDFQLELIGLSGLIGFNADAKPVGQSEYRRATKVESGKSYAFVADNAKLATPVASTRDFGYFYVEDVKPENGVFTGGMSSAFTFTAKGDGFTIQQPDGRYIYMDDQGKNNFDVTATLGDGNEFVWTVAIAADGTATIKNVARGKWIQYSSGYTSYGSYSSTQDASFLPVLFEKID